MTPAAFRSRFPIFQTRTYVNSCSQGALSIDVDAALDRFRDSWREHGSPWDAWVAEVERLRGLVAGLLGADEDEIAVLPNASVAIGAIATAVPFQAGKEGVVLGELEFPTAAHAWLAQARRGARIAWARATDGTLPTAAYERAVSGRTRVVTATSVAYRSGFRTDLSALSALCRDRGAWLFVDDYQRTGTEPLDVHALGADFLVTGALKYLLGASGVAFLYVRRELIPLLEPAVTGWFGRVDPFAFRADRLDWAPDARRFETGSPPVPSIYAAAAGAELVSRMGLAAIEQRIASLVDALMTIAQTHGFAALTPDDPARRGPLVVLRSTNAGELVAGLARRGIIASARGDGVRLSFHAYNDEQDVEHVTRALLAEARLLVRV
jgi:selenocysteine lyase/cysteine desulfurase